MVPHSESGCGRGTSRRNGRPVKALRACIHIADLAEFPKSVRPPGGQFPQGAPRRLPTGAVYGHLLPAPSDPTGTHSWLDVFGCGYTHILEVRSACDAHRRPTAEPCGGTIKWGFLRAALCSPIDQVDLRHGRWVGSHERRVESRRVGSVTHRRKWRCSRRPGALPGAAQNALRAGASQFCFGLEHPRVIGASAGAITAPN